MCSSKWFYIFNFFSCPEFQTLARFSPLLLSGIEEDLVHLLKDDNEVVKEGVLHVLAKAGGTIREQLGVSSRCNYGIFSIASVKLIA